MKMLLGSIERVIKTKEFFLEESPSLEPAAPVSSYQRSLFDLCRSLLKILISLFHLLMIRLGISEMINKSQWSLDYSGIESVTVDHRRNSRN